MTSDLRVDSFVVCHFVPDLWDPGKQLTGPKKPAGGVGSHGVRVPRRGGSRRVMVTQVSPSAEEPKSQSTQQGPSCQQQVQVNCGNPVLLAAWGDRK